MHPWKLKRLAIAVFAFPVGLRLRAKGGGETVSPGGWQGWRGGRRMLWRSAGRLAAVCMGLCLAGAESAEGGAKAGGVEEAMGEWNQRGKPVAEALRLLARVNAELRAGGREDLLAHRAVLFEAACHRANAEELRALAAMIPDLAVDAPEAADAGPRFKECITFYGTAVFQHEVSKLKARPAKLEMAPSKAAPPPELAVGPKPLRDAWLAWRGAIEPFERLKEEARNAPAEANEMLRGRHAIALLKKLGPTPAPGLWRQIIGEEERALQAAARGGGNTWHHTRRALHRGILLSLLADGRMEEAVGAVCSQILMEEGYPNDPSRKTYAARAREFLGAQGLDWELIFTGLLLAERAVMAGDFRAALANTEAWLMLGAHGSPRGVQLGIDWIAHANMGSEEARPFLLQVLGPAPEPPKVLLDPRPKRQKALPAEVRAKAAAALGKLLDRAQPLAPLHRTIEDVPPWLAKDLEEPLRKLLAHPSRLIAARALWLLRSADLVPPETKIAGAIPPIRIRLKVDGAPLAGTLIAVQAAGIRQQQRIATNADGELVIPLDHVLEPANINAVHLTVAPEQRTGVMPNLQNVAEAPIPGRRDEAASEVPAVARKDLPNPWFAVSVPVQAFDEKAQEVAIETGELEVGLKGGSGVPNTAQVGVMLIRDARNPLGSVRGIGKPGESVVFDRVQVGAYRMLVEGPELALRPWEVVHVTKRGSLKLVELAPGRSVRATLAGAGAPNLRLVSVAKLTRDGDAFKAITYTRPDGWDRVPLGKYRLRILSSTELEAAIKARGINRPLAAKSPRHAGYEVEFELTADSPAVVDLGVITLKAEEDEVKR